VSSEDPSWVTNSLEFSIDELAPEWFDVLKKPEYSKNPEILSFAKTSIQEIMQFAEENFAKVLPQFIDQLPAIKAGWKRDMRSLLEHIDKLINEVEVENKPENKPATEGISPITEEMANYADAVKPYVTKKDKLRLEQRNSASRSL